MEVVRTKNALVEAIRRGRMVGKTVGLVPTMGALHNGHLSLVATALKSVSLVVGSIFVNPTQFGPNEDFAKYPRSEEADLTLFRNTGVSIAYLPTAEEMYPQGSLTRVTVPGLGNDLCGAVRPGHFDGVATVVTKLFLQVQPDMAVFGEKDYQQLCIIRRMSADLDIPVQIMGAPTVREPDGLALSSRNRYLSEAERKIAPALYRVLSGAAQELRGGQGADAVIAKAKDALLAAGFAKVDYVEWRDAQTLGPVRDAKAPSRLLASAHLGAARLIDNVAVA